jgi:hypothetical protein
MEGLDPPGFNFGDTIGRVLNNIVPYIKTGAELARKYGEKGLSKAGQYISMAEPYLQNLKSGAKRIIPFLGSLFTKFARGISSIGSTASDFVGSAFMPAKIVEDEEDYFNALVKKNGANAIGAANAINPTKFEPSRTPLLRIYESDSVRQGALSVLRTTSVRDSVSGALNKSYFGAEEDYDNTYVAPTRLPYIDRIIERETISKGLTPAYKGYAEYF